MKLVLANAPPIISHYSIFSLTKNGDIFLTLEKSIKNCKCLILENSTEMRSGRTERKLAFSDFLFIFINYAH